MLRCSATRTATGVHACDVILHHSASHDPHMMSHFRLTQLEDVLRTYVMYNFDLGELHVHVHIQCCTCAFACTAVY